MHIYTAIEDKVESVQLSTETQQEVTQLLSAEAEHELLSKLFITHNDEADCNEFVYRYRTDTVDSKLNVGDYLVKMNAGTLVAMSAAKFESEYLHTGCDVKQTAVKSLAAVVVERLGIAEFTVDAVKAAIPDAWISDKKITVDLKDACLNAVEGLDILLNGLFASEKFTAESTITLDFSNSTTDQFNIFNLIQLDTMRGIFTRLNKDPRKQITALTFVGTGDAPSAVADSVTEAQFYNWVDGVRSTTGVASNSAITR